MAALRHAVSPDFSYSQSYLSLLSVSGSMTGIICCAPPALRALLTTRAPNAHARRAHNETGFHISWSTNPARAYIAEPEQAGDNLEDNQNPYDSSNPKTSSIPESKPGDDPSEDNFGAERIPEHPPYARVLSHNALRLNPRLLSSWPTTRTRFRCSYRASEEELNSIQTLIC